MIKKIINHFVSTFRKERFFLFSKYFSEEKGRLLDLGGGDGSYLSKFRDELINFDIYIADIDESALLEAKRRGFKVLKLNEKPPFPFSDKEWDVVFCNSVIEHYTGNKKNIYKMGMKNQFIPNAIKYQKLFALEVDRISKSYFVQTPHKFFPIESHTQFPLVGYLPRSVQVKLIMVINKFWIKRTQPDWKLLIGKDMKKLFPDAEIVIEKYLMLPKSIIAIKKEFIKTI